MKFQDDFIKSIIDIYHNICENSKGINHIRRMRYDILRIIAGSRRGKKLFGFDGDAVRPTSDRVRENLFNIIAAYVHDASVLDLFGGTGALSAEALSRGAKHALICDNADSSIELIRRNIRALEFEDCTKVVKTDAISFLKRNTEVFDIIFLDPPYNQGLLSAAVKLIAKGGMLSKDGVIVAESGGEDVDTPSGLELIKDRKYGKTSIKCWVLADAD